MKKMLIVLLLLLLFGCANEKQETEVDVESVDLLLNQVYDSVEFEYEELEIVEKFDFNKEMGFRIYTEEGSVLETGGLVLLSTYDRGLFRDFFSEDFHTISYTRYMDLVTGSLDFEEGNVALMWGSLNSDFAESNVRFEIIQEEETKELFLLIHISEEYKTFVKKIKNEEYQKLLNSLEVELQVFR